MTIDAARFRADLETLATFGADGDGGVSRPSYSAADRQARSWLRSRCEDAGLDYREDAVGNVFMRLGDGAGPPVWAGSHLDSVPNGGRLDGALGVVASLEVVRCLRERGTGLRRPVEAVAFADEEGGFLGFLGSKAVARGLVADDLRGVRGRDGRLLTEALTASGYDPERVAEARVDPAAVHAYVELHIEQGAILHQAGLDIGVVSHIVGVARCSIEFEGRPDHAGTTPMHLRRDASRGAALLLTQIADLPALAGAVDAVVTCGRMELDPDAYNVVPGRVRLGFDIRDRRREVISMIERSLAVRAAEAAETHDLGVEHVHLGLTEPTPLDRRIGRSIGEAAERAGAGWRVMPSGAGHDAQVLAPVIPTGMIFVPSVDGRSHSPLEHTSWEDLTRGVEVLHDVVRRLATTD